MSTTTIRVSDKTHRLLARLAHDSGQPMTEVVDAAIELYRRRRILEHANAEYAALRADPAAWADVQAERATWDGTIADGLNRE